MDVLFFSRGEAAEVLISQRGKRYICREALASGATENDSCYLLARVSIS